MRGNLAALMLFVLGCSGFGANDAIASAPGSESLQSAVSVSADPFGHVL